MTAVASTLSPTAYWYLTRATGAVALVLLTASVVLGILGTVRFTAPRWPRFAVEAVHRDVSLLVIVFLVIHIVTTVLDGYAPITLLDGIFPFLSPYRPLWLGLGTLSFDLLLAITITSLVRRRIGYRSWRAVHWLSYASWPIAVLHTLGTGSDAKVWWLLLLTVFCIAAVLAAALARIGAVERARRGVRGGAFALSVIAPLGIMIFALVGPLQHGWAQRAGTPAKLLGVSSTSVASRPAAPPARSVTKSFSSRLSGRIAQTSAPGGAIVELRLNLSGHVRGKLRVRMGGQPLPEGGLSMTGSQVDLSVVGLPAAYGGAIQSLQGTHIQARVSNAYGSALNLIANLHINPQTSTVVGVLSGTPTGSGG